MEFLCSLEISVGPRLLAHGLEQTVIRGNWDNPIYERERHIFSVCILIMYDFRGLLLSLSLSLSERFADPLKALRKVSGYALI